MSKLKVHGLTLSVDGYVAGPDQSVEQPLGLGGQELHQWAFATKTFRDTHGMDGGEAGVDDEWAARGFSGIGATIMGRNMFGPIRGPWKDPEWRGWWGEEPPFHHPVFVLTHHPRPSLWMEGGTTFHFVTEGIEAALARAQEAAGDQDIRLGGGAQTVRQYLEAKLVDELSLAIAPVVLGSGEKLFDNLSDLQRHYACVEFAGPERAAHFRLVRRT